MEKFGFETICAEDYTVREQAEMFAQASHVIAPHGAGLGNIVFCGPDTRVLELFSAFLTEEYWSIANQMQLQYYAFECMGDAQTYLSEADRDAIGGMFPRNAQDMVVPVDDVIDFVKSTFLTA